MRFLWISGWAVPPAWFSEQACAAFPEATHTAVSPSAAAAALVSKKFDVLGGYSLGALWLLMHQKNVVETRPVILIAPFFSFIAENGGGGRVVLAQLRLQRRRFRHDAQTAVNDFYRLSGLENSVPPAGELSTEQIATMDTELGWLEEWRVTEPSPANWRGFVGRDDLLLNADILQGKWPAARIVPDAGHAPGPLLRAAAKELPSKVSR
jgi:hypothetical protein